MASYSPINLRWRPGVWLRARAQRHAPAVPRADTHLGVGGQAAGRTSYYFGSQRVALRQGEVGQGQDSVSWLHADHLGSLSEVTSATGGRIAQERYYPYGRVRWGSAPTSYNFTGQRLDSYINLLEMGARWYDPALGRFVSPDPIVPQPGNPQSLNRYSYGLNNPLRYIDPTGHYECDPQSGCTGDDIPDITGYCSQQAGFCYLDPNLDKAIAFYAQLYEIPYELLYVTLLVEYMDDRQTGQGAFDTFIQSSALMAKYGSDDTQQAFGRTGLAIAHLIEEILHPGNNPGVGYNNIHSQTAWKAQKWFADNYAGTDMANLVRPNQDLPDLIITLAKTDGNIRYAAATLRQLSDMATGNNSPHENLTVDKQAVIYDAYRGGPGRPLDFQQRQLEETNFGPTYLLYYYRYQLFR